VTRASAFRFFLLSGPRASELRRQPALGSVGAFAAWGIRLALGCSGGHFLSMIPSEVKPVAGYRIRLKYPDGVEGVIERPELVCYAQRAKVGNVL
jgi:hypothetical protein